MTEPDLGQVIAYKKEQHVYFEKIEKSLRILNSKKL